MAKNILFLVLLISFSSCNIINLQKGSSPALEGTSPFGKIDFKDESIYVTVDNQEYKWLKLDTLDVSVMVSLFKENDSNKWQKRFSEDLVEYLNKLDVYPKQQELFTLEDEEGIIKTILLKFESKKRDEAKDHFESTYDKEIDLNQILSKQEAIEDIDQLEDLIRSKYAYAFLNEVNVSKEIQALKDGITDEITTYDLALNIGKFINKFGDGHSRIHNVSFKESGELPFSVQAYEDKIICTKDGQLLNADYPFLHAINDVPVSKLLEISEEYFTPNASPQFKQRVKVSRLNRIGEILKIAGSSDTNLKIVLESEDGKTTSLELEMDAYNKRRSVSTDQSEKDNGPFQVKHFGDVGYLKIESMVGLTDENSLASSLGELENSKGLIIDVRDNGGGLRNILIELAPHFINEKEGFVVGNVARLRTNTISKNHNLSDRYLYQEEDAHFDDDVKQNLNDWLTDFSMKIVLDDSLYSPYYYLYIAGHDKPKFSNIPTVVLLNEGCFSATDIFLSTFKEIDGVTLIGTPSGGGSGRSLRYKLTNSLIEVRLSSIVSFQPNGFLYDGIGVQPDIEVKQSGISDLLKQTDSQLEFALDFLKENGKE